MKEYSHLQLVAAEDMYGSDAYGSNVYSCSDTRQTCETTTPPNTGFINSPDAAVELTAGIVLLAIALTGIGFFIAKKLKKAKSN